MTRSSLGSVTPCFSPRNRRRKSLALQRKRLCEGDYFLASATLLLSPVHDGIRDEHRFTLPLDRRRELRIPAVYYPAVYLVTIVAHDAERAGPGTEFAHHFRGGSFHRSAADDRRDGDHGNALRAIHAPMSATPSMGAKDNVVGFEGQITAART